MDIYQIIALATGIVTFILGFITRNYTSISNKKIPIQNLCVAVLASILCSVSIYFNVLDAAYNVAILTCFSSVLGTAGIYDTVKATIETVLKIKK